MMVLICPSIFQKWQKDIGYIVLQKTLGTIQKKIVFGSLIQTQIVVCTPVVAEKLAVVDFFPGFEK